MKVHTELLARAAAAIAEGPETVLQFVALECADVVRARNKRPHAALVPPSPPNAPAGAAGAVGGVYQLG